MKSQLLNPQTPRSLLQYSFLGWHQPLALKTLRRRAVVLALHAHPLTGSLSHSTGSGSALSFCRELVIGESGEEIAGKPEVHFDDMDHWIQTDRSRPSKGTNREVIFKMHVEQFGNIASVFYSHSAVFTENGNVDDVRRVNSCSSMGDPGGSQV